MNRVAFMDGPRNIGYEERPVPEPKPGEVLVKVEYVGICGSDVHYYKHGRAGNFVVNGKMILGHESGGSIVAVGENVSSLAVGDRVALEPGVTCGKCEFCKTGRYNLCPDVEFFATPPFDGVFCDYVAFPADKCFKLPDNVSTMEGALVEPLAVGLHACKQGGVKPGDTVVIQGAGCIGLVSLLSAKAYGASNIIVVDVQQKRLEYAKKLGATSVINAKEQDVLAQINTLTQQRGADVVIETAGSDATVMQTTFIAARGGTIVLVGITVDEVVPFHFGNVMAKELSIKSVFRYCNLYPTAVNAIGQGTINVKDIVTHTFGFGEIKEALDYVIDNSADVVKAVVKIS